MKAQLSRPSLAEFEEFEASLKKMLMNNHKIIALLEDGLYKSLWRVW